MKLSTPSHTTVVAYLALFVAIGGSAYAVSKIGSAQIENRSIKGKDVADEALGPRQVDERGLEGPLAVGMATSVGCDPQPSVSVDCIGKTIRLESPGALLVIVTGTADSDGAGLCLISVDGATSNGQFIDKETRTLAATKVTTKLPKGRHSVALSCTESVPGLSLSDLAISAIAVTNADLG